MKRQGYRDSLHVLTAVSPAFSQPTSAAVFVPPAATYLDIFKALSITGGRQMSQSATARVAGIRVTLVDTATDEQTTTGLWVRGSLEYVKPTMARVGAHELGMKDWFGVQEEEKLVGAGRWKQFLLKYDALQGTLVEHSLDGIGVPYGLVGVTAAGFRGLFDEYNQRFPVPPVNQAGVAGQDQRQFGLYASQTPEVIAWTAHKSHVITFAGLGANVDPASRAASTAYTSGASIGGTEMWFRPGHHLPVMCGLMKFSVVMAGPRALIGGNVFESGTNTVPDQTADSNLFMVWEVFVEGWHPLRRQQPGESRR